MKKLSIIFLVSCLTVASAAHAAAPLASGRSPRSSTPHASANAPGSPTSAAAGRDRSRVKRASGQRLGGVLQPCSGQLVRPDQGLGNTADVMPASGGTATLNVWPSGNCGFVLELGDPTMLTNVTPASGTGPTVVSYTVQPNTGAARVATISAFGLTYYIPQAAASVQPNPASSNVPSVLGTPTSCSGVAGTSIRSGVTLAPGTWIMSPNGKYQFIYQTDGNLVVYNTATRGVVWANNRMNTGGRAVMQTDGNLVSYNAQNYAIWATGTWRYPGAAVTMQDDGNVVVYAKDSCSAVWSLRR